MEDGTQMLIGKRKSIEEKKKTAVAGKKYKAGLAINYI
jgi:hypothetical protein